MADGKSYVVRLIKGLSLTTPFGVKLQKKGRGLTIGGDDKNLPYYKANSSIEVTEVGSKKPVGVGTTRRKKKRKALRTVKVTPTAPMGSRPEPEPEPDEAEGDEPVALKDAWTPDGLKTMKKPELVKLAEALELDVYGTDRRSDLIGRIEETREQEADA